MRAHWKLGGRVNDSYFFYEVTPLAGLGNAILRTRYVRVCDFWKAA